MNCVSKNEGDREKIQVSQNLRKDGQADRQTDRSTNGSHQRSSTFGTNSLSCWKLCGDWPWSINLPSTKVKEKV